MPDVSLSDDQLKEIVKAGRIREFSEHLDPEDKVRLARVARRMLTEDRMRKSGSEVDVRPLASERLAALETPHLQTTIFQRAKGISLLPEAFGGAAARTNLKDQFVDPEHPQPAGPFGSSVKAPPQTMGPAFPKIEEIATASTMEELKGYSHRVWGSPFAPNEEARSLKEAIVSRATELDGNKDGYLDELMKGAGFLASAVTPHTRENVMASTFMWNFTKRVFGPVATTLGAAWKGEEALTALTMDDPDTVARGVVDAVDILTLGATVGPKVAGPLSRKMLEAGSAARTKGMRGALEALASSDEAVVVNAALSAADNTVRDTIEASRTARGKGAAEEATTLAARSRQAERERLAMIDGNAPRAEKQVTKLVAEPPRVKSKRELVTEVAPKRTARQAKREKRVIEQLQQDPQAGVALVKSLESRVSLELGGLENVDQAMLRSLTGRIAQIKKSRTLRRAPSRDRSRSLGRLIAQAENELEAAGRNARLPKSATMAQIVSHESGAIQAEALKHFAGASVGTAIALENIRRSEEGTFNPLNAGLFVVMMAGTGAAFTRPSFRTALANAYSISQPRLRKLMRAPGELAEPNWEKVFEELFLPMVPAKLTGPHLRVAGRLGMAGYGGIMGGTYGDDDFDPTDMEDVGNALVGTVIGMALSIPIMSGVDALLPAIPAKAIFQRLLTVGRGLPSEWLAMQRAVMLKRAGIIREGGDVAIEMGTEFKKNPQVGALAQRILTLESAPESIASERIRDGIVNIRVLFDEMRNDIIKYKAGFDPETSPELKKKLLENVGYLPAKYGIYENPEVMELAAKTVRMKGGSLGRMGDINYLKKKLPRELIPDAVLDSEIVNNPGYLLGKQIGVVQADLTVAEIASKTIANPAWTVAEDLAASVTRQLMEVTRVGGKTKPKFRMITRSPVSIRTKVLKKGATKADDLLEVSVLDSKNLSQALDDPRLVKRKDFKMNEIKREYLPEAPEGWRPFREYKRELIEAPDGTRFLKLGNSAKLGQLKNRYVLEEIAQDIEFMTQIPKGIWRFIDRGTAVFKMSKVTLNPATLMRNLIGNVILADLGGVSPVRIDKFLGARGDYFGQTARYREARRAGTFKGQWFGTEVRDMLPKAPVPNSEMDNAFTGLMKWVDKRVLAKGVNKFGRFHEASEEYFKMVMYNHGRDSLNLAPPEAAAFAHKWIFDYQDVPRFVQIARKSPVGTPFISFSYKALPRVAEDAFAFGDPKKMLRFWKYPIAIGAYNEASSRKLGIEQSPLASMDTALRVVGTGMGMSMGEFGKIKKLGPHWAGDQQMLMHWKDDFDRFNMTDMTWLSPWGDVTELGKGVLGRQLSEMGLPFPRQLEPSGPWLQSFVGMMTGKDMFTGKQIVNPVNVGTMGAVYDRLRFMGKTFLPALTPGVGRSWEHLAKSFGGDYGSNPYVSKPIPAISKEVFAWPMRQFEAQQALGHKASEFEVPLRETEAAIEKLIAGVPKRDRPEVKRYMFGKSDLESVPSRSRDEAVMARRGFKRAEELNKRLDELPSKKELPPTSAAYKRLLKGEEVR